MKPEDQEMVDVYDDDGTVTGTLTRHEADEQNATYGNVIVFVFTTDDRVWLQKRSHLKRHFPGLWDVSACGALAHAEDPLDAAKRELQEEMGIECDLTFVEKFLNLIPSEDGTKTYKRLSHIFVGITEDTPVGNEEVESVIAFEIHDLLREAQLYPERFVPCFSLELEKALKMKASET